MKIVRRSGRRFLYIAWPLADVKASVIEGLIAICGLIDEPHEEPDLM